MIEYKRVVKNILNQGESRDTRSGKVLSLFNQQMEFDLRQGFPAPTIKRLAFKSVMGELLWFLSGSTDLKDLIKYSNKKEGDWTIWTDDAARWHSKNADNTNPTDTGLLYGHQWRNYGGKVDQIKQVIHSLKTDPFSRYHVVTAWDPVGRAQDAMALPACHRDFQFHVSNGGELNLHFTMRSNDIYLGSPFNIASYAALCHIIAKLTGLKVGKLA